MGRKKKTRKRRTRESRLNNLVYNYKYLYNELFGDQRTPLYLEVGQKDKKLSIPRGKVRALVYTLNEMIRYADEKNEKNNKKLWDTTLIKDSEYNLRTVKYRRKLWHYSILEYINRTYKINITENMIAVLSEKLNIPFYLFKNVHESWKAYMHKRIRNTEDKIYMSDEDVKNEVGYVYVKEIDDIFTEKSQEEW